jgi:AcrR family transcriptional regulator
VSSDRLSGEVPDGVGQNGTVSTLPEEATPTSPRQRILDVTLALMAQRGVAGTSMRDLAAAAGLNVASLYHYFPSKHDLLLAVLEERGLLGDLSAPSRTAGPSGTKEGFADLLNDMLQSMLDVEDFIRLMLGEVMRGDQTVKSVGTELFATTLDSIQRWLEETQPDLVAGGRAAGMAKMLRAMLIGVFFEHVAGVLEDDDDTEKAFHRRAQEMAAALFPVERQDT